jgi:hypothetical protein
MNIHLISDIWTSISIPCVLYKLIINKYFKYNLKFYSSFQYNHEIKVNNIGDISLPRCKLKLNHISKELDNAGLYI